MATLLVLVATSFLPSDGHADYDGDGVILWFNDVDNTTATLSVVIPPLCDTGLCDGSKVVICHYPPGNPSNANTLTVGASAVPAHLAHGDATGACPDDPQPFCRCP